jgi:nicotinate dehydrogenase FAD-subunit
MERFTYVRAQNVQQAVSLLNEAGVRSRVLAGGTDLMLLARADRHLCDRVVDITLIPELANITQDGDTVTIGAATSFSRVIESPIVNETAPMLAQACRQVGAVQIRNMGTIGGNVANAAACADSLPALVCMEAVAKVQTPEAMLEWPVSELVVRPNSTLIPRGGLLVSLSYRVPPPGSRGVFLKLGRRNAMAISRLTVAALGCLDEAGRIAEARLVPGSATPQIRRFTDVEHFVLGRLPDEGLFQEAGRLAVNELVRMTGKRWSSEFKEPALQTYVSRALRAVFAPSMSVRVQGADS